MVDEEERTELSECEKKGIEEHYKKVRATLSLLEDMSEAKKSNESKPVDYSKIFACAVI